MKTLQLQSMVEAVFIVDMSTARGIWKSRARGGSGRLNMTTRLHQTMRGVGERERRTKREGQTWGGKGRGPGAKREHSQNGNIIEEWEAGEREAHVWRFEGWGSGEKSWEEPRWQHRLCNRYWHCWDSAEASMHCGMLMGTRVSRFSRVSFGPDTHH